MEQAGRFYLGGLKSSLAVAITSLAGLVAICAGQASATPIAIDNFSFERPETLVGTSTLGCPAGWVCSIMQTSMVAGVYSPTAAQYAGGSGPGPFVGPAGMPSYTPGGSDAVFLRAGPREMTVTQTTSELIRSNQIYTMDVWVGHQTNAAWGTSSIQFLADGMLLATSGALADPGAGNWAQYTLSFMAAADDFRLGQRLGISLIAGSGGAADFDMVSLSSQPSVSVDPFASAPEPSTLLLFGAGLLAVAARGRTRSRLNSAI